MRRLVPALLLGACTISVPQVDSLPAPSITVGSSPAAGYQLSDPELQRRLGVEPPSDVDWRRTVGGHTVLGIETRPDPQELELVAAAMREVPAAMDEKVSPGAIVRVPEIEEGQVHEQAAAYSRGPDIYLLDRTFQISPDGSTRMDMARAYLHELAHVAQFLTLRPAYVRAVLEGRLSSISPVAGSELVSSFAAATGWLDRAQDPLQVDWHLPQEVAASTPYGRLRPDEDMAEAVALVAMGRADWLPADRVGWVEEWLQGEAERLARGKPWAPAGSSEVLSPQPVYDEEQVEALMSQFSHAEPLYFALPPEAPTHDQLAATIAARLQQRGLEGSLERHADERLPRYGGLFRRDDGLAYRVELWDFRQGTGFEERPDHPVLTYVVLW